MGQGGRWAGASFRGVGRNALGLWPLAVVTIGLTALHRLLMHFIGADESAIHLANSLRDGTSLASSDTGLLLLGGLLVALEGAIRIAVGLALWAPDGSGLTWGQARVQMRGRWTAVVGAGAIITILWALPEMFGLLAMASQHRTSGVLLVLLGLGVLVYVAGRRYLALPLALYEKMPALRSFQESKPRLMGRRKSVAMAVFLVGLPTTVLVMVSKSSIAALQQNLAQWPSLRAVVPIIWSALLTVADAALLSRLAWEVYRDLSQPSDVPPSVSLPARAVATVRLAWLNRKDY